MSLTLRGIAILHNHLAELRKVLARMEPDHIARETISARIQECERALERG